jgi:hypothetical protein
VPVRHGTQVERRHGTWTEKVAHTVNTGVAGHGTQYLDPLWRVPASLNPLEQTLLRTEPLRRLHMIAHAGAASMTTTQTYSRLEHTLGVFTLAAHFHPTDQPLRAAALLHDIGHLPFSHTFEGIAGLNHHTLGLDLLREAAISRVLEAHGIDPQNIADLLSGRTRSAMTPPPGLLGLDHLDSYVRSARFGARLDIDPTRLLGALQLMDGAISADLPTAQILVELVCAEARLHVSWDNLAPSAALQHLIRRLLDTGRHEPSQLACMTDAQLWALLDGAAETRGEAGMLRTRPYLLRLHPADHDSPTAPSAWDFALRKIYASAPLIDGVPIETASPALTGKLADLQRLPTRYRAWWDTPTDSPQHIMSGKTVRDTATAMRPVAMLVDSCHRVLPLLRSFVLAERWAQPSVLEHWSIAGLAGHLARSAFNLERALDARNHSHEQRHALDAVGYYAASAPDAPESPIGRRIRELGDAEAADGPQALADRFAASTARLQERALPMDPAKTVEMFNRVLPIDDCAAACLLELVIHADDLAVSLGLQPPAFDEQAADLVAITLTRISRKRHGDTAVIGALARTERAPAGGISAF